MRKVPSISIITILSLLISCTSTISEYSIKQVYKRDGFGSKVISGFSIGIGPVLTSQDVNLLDRLNAEEIYAEIKKKRSDLQIISYDDVKKNISSYSADSLFMFLNNQNTAAVQLMDEFWSDLQCDLLMIAHLEGGMHIKTFEATEKKMIKLEAELWSRKDQEVVWRSEITGTADGKKISDEVFIRNALVKIYLELPYTAPSYENSDW